MPRRKQPVFSAIKAVKANARERLGTPPPERVLPHTRDKDRAQPKHKRSLADLVAGKGESDS